MRETFELFPTPVTRVPGVLSADQALALREALVAAADTPNSRSGELSHTEILSPQQHPALAVLAQRLAPELEAFGELIFGERLQWQVKEMWGNVSRTGGQQAVHNHANCFISGVIYLTEVDPSAQTVFIRHLGGHEFSFSNSHEGAATGPFNAEKWLAPAPRPGDLVLFPSHLLHEVPVNRGGLRVTLAFNAIPHRLNAWGYAVSLSA